jgi:hypothetical protein
VASIRPVLISRPPRLRGSATREWLGHPDRMEAVTLEPHPQEVTVCPPTLA